jgi:hypothetical protein
MAGTWQQLVARLVTATSKERVAWNRLSNRHYGAKRLVSWYGEDLQGLACRVV